MQNTGQRPVVVVVGGGYGGVNVAKALDDQADVVLVEPKEAFFHNVAALRGLVRPEWLADIFIPYDGLLGHGRVIQDRAVSVTGSTVVLSSGEEISADFIVLATGSAYPYPAKSDSLLTADAHARFRATHAELEKSGHVLLVGAGPVGIELAGEIHEVWPETSVTIVDQADDLLGGSFSVELRQELQRQLTDIGVDVLLGSPLQDEPPIAPGTFDPFTVTTVSGREIAADIWFRCYGVVPSSDFLSGTLVEARTADGFIKVNDQLQVIGSDVVFALGDVSTADAKMAGFAGAQAAVVAENIKVLINGEGSLRPYVPMGEVILVPIGSEGGAGQLPGQDGIVGSEVVADLKGRTMMTERFADLLGASPST